MAKLPEQELDRGVVKNKTSEQFVNAGEDKETQQDASEGNVDSGEGAPHTEDSVVEEESQEGVSRSDAPAGFEEEE